VTHYLYLKVIYIIVEYEKTLTFMEKLVMYKLKINDYFFILKTNIKQFTVKSLEAFDDNVRNF
jgi:hypothetical protein